MLALSAIDGRLIDYDYILLLTQSIRYIRTSLTYGHPYMIDVQDCDARLPSSGDPNDLYMDELLRLSILLGRVLKTIYRYSIFVRWSTARLISVV